MMHCLVWHFTFEVHVTLMVKIFYSILFINCNLLLFEEVAVDFKLLFEHDLSPIFNDECIWFQGLGCPQDLPVFLYSRYPPQLELKKANHTVFTCNCRQTFETSRHEYICL